MYVCWHHHTAQIGKGNDLHSAEQLHSNIKRFQSVLHNNFDNLNIPWKVIGKEEPWAWENVTYNPHKIWSNT